ncbi:MAG TPA: flippase [Dongiaceae bacterium]|nr:flippase [Dongiaceae bacterium]
MHEAPKHHNGHLTSGRLLAKNTVWNLIGFTTPLLVAVFCIPVLIRELGKDRFGILTLAWALIGYASLFDLGLGRALTQLVARKLGAGEEREIPSLVWTSLFLMSFFGILGAGIIYGLSPWLVHRWLNVPVSLQAETIASFRLLGFSIPFVITSSGLRGLLEAQQRFGFVNALRIPMGVLTFVGPLSVLPFSRRLVPIVASLVLVRIVLWAAHLAVCLNVAPELRRSLAWRRSSVVPLMRFGGWMTVTNIVSPLLVTVDRFMIGALVSMTAVAYYATPYEVVTKVLLIPGALMAVMFPAFSLSFERDLERTALLFWKSLRSILLVLFPILLFTVVLAQDGLRLWLGADFAQHSYRVLQWLSVGVFLNSLAQPPFCFLQGIGRPDLSATLHLIELPLYLALLWWLISTQGIVGAAIAWTIRVTVDAIGMFWLARTRLPQRRAISLKVVLLPAVALLILLLAGTLEGPVVKAIFLIGTTLCFVLFAWFRVLTPEERSFTRTESV